MAGLMSKVSGAGPVNHECKIGVVPPSFAARIVRHFAFGVHWPRSLSLLISPRHFAFQPLPLMLRSLPCRSAKPKLAMPKLARKSAITIMPTTCWPSHPSPTQYDRLYPRVDLTSSPVSQLVTPDSPTQRVGGEPLKAFKPCRISSRCSAWTTPTRKRNWRKFVNAFNGCCERETRLDGRAEGGRRGDQPALPKKARSPAAPREAMARRRRHHRQPPHDPEHSRPAAGQHEGPELLEVRGEVYLTKNRV